MCKAYGLSLTMSAFFALPAGVLSKAPPPCIPTPTAGNVAVICGWHRPLCRGADRQQCPAPWCPGSHDTGRAHPAGSSSPVPPVASGCRPCSGGCRPSGAWGSSARARTCSPGTPPCCPSAEPYKQSVVVSSCVQPFEVPTNSTLHGQTSMSVSLSESNFRSRNQTGTRTDSNFRKMQLQKQGKKRNRNGPNFATHH